MFVKFRLVGIRPHEIEQRPKTCAGNVNRGLGRIVNEREGTDASGRFRTETESVFTVGMAGAP